MATQSFDWSHYQTLAEELLSQPKESNLRSAISRAYYFVYHLARQRIEDNGFFFIERQDTHRQVWEKFSGSADASCRSLGSVGQMLKQKREAADYESIFPRVHEDAPALVAIAASFAIKLAQLDKRLPTNTGIRR